MANLNVHKDVREPQAPAKPSGPRIEFAKDSKGREIGAVELDPVALFDITLVLGEAASNQAALNQALLACSTYSIEGELVARPATVLQLKALLGRLGFHGFAALREALAKFEGVSPEAGIAAAKN